MKKLLLSQLLAGLFLISMNTVIGQNQSNLGEKIAKAKKTASSSWRKSITEFPVKAPESDQDINAAVGAIYDVEMIRFFYPDLDKSEVELQHTKLLSAFQGWPEKSRADVIYNLLYWVFMEKSMRDYIQSHHVLRLDQAKVPDVQFGILDDLPVVFSTAFKPFCDAVKTTKRKVSLTCENVTTRDEGLNKAIKDVDQAVADMDNAIRNKDYISARSANHRIERLAGILHMYKPGHIKSSETMKRAGILMADAKKIESAEQQKFVSQYLTTGLNYNIILKDLNEILGVNNQRILLGQRIVDGSGEYMEKTIAGPIPSLFIHTESVFDYPNGEQGIQKNIIYYQKTGGKWNYWKSSTPMESYQIVKKGIQDFPLPLPEEVVTVFKRDFPVYAENQRKANLYWIGTKRDYAGCRDRYVKLLDVSYHDKPADLNIYPDGYRFRMAKFKVYFSVEETFSGKSQKHNCWGEFWLSTDKNWIDWTMVGDLDGGIIPKMK